MVREAGHRALHRGRFSKPVRPYLVTTHPALPLRKGPSSRQARHGRTAAIREMLWPFDLFAGVNHF
jgi:hypothetical protein